MNAIDRERLLESIGVRGHKLPADFTGIFHGVELRDWRGQLVCIAEVCVNPATPDHRRHRITVMCPTCGALVPFGRLHQHIDTAACSTHKYRDQKRRTRRQLRK